MYKTLISPAELQQNYQAGNWVIVDCRFDLADTQAGRRAYESAHIPGAIYAHLDDDLSGEIIPGTTGRHPLPTVEEAIALFSLWGIDDSVQVIAYDDKGGGVASRLWWMLRWLGHEAVAVLDGGWPAWQAADLAISDKLATVRPRQFKPQSTLASSIDAAGVDEVRERADYVVVDSRTPERYRGEVEPIDPVAGHIPGAINLPFPANLADGKFLSPEELKARFAAALGNTKGEQVVFYCGSGVTACHNILAYAHAGLGDAVLYPGSWSDWITDTSRPVG
ncbi:sulfurtransferase [Flavilitoribacter nigricans]|uniref:Sulfurtransferase n=1 Tax=Flavilitoribacter nigricans (strain ATCC 23147 / DSM 23189 / NBRC 102662 / NCIMB 1420 / SS-2) TaxID=1122177 RepID=A0A2D0NHU6_FLAN2|nr:sulfurtransferase [Flavilitoribacter nigricans]PHN08047.1 sulfurtransferase [Flavilitoribacter nigricans DSM 23189 = NBRC 102662]